MPDAPRYWTAPRDWVNETAFVVAGGPTFDIQPRELLRGQRVVVINSSYKKVPWADTLFYGDDRWWHDHQKALQNWRGEIVTCGDYPTPKGVCRMRKRRQPGPSCDRDEVMVRRTSVTGVLNLLMHRGVCRIVTIALDGKRDEQGRTHHTGANHRWPVMKSSWEQHAIDLRSFVQPLRDAGIVVANVSPGSAHKFWPIVDNLGELFEDERIWVELGRLQKITSGPGVEMPGTRAREPATPRPSEGDLHA